MAIAAIASACAAGSASAAEPIEGIWSFSGGAVGIQAQPDGTFTGTVVAPTKFAQCYHPVGERVWTGMRLQSDGSYWGSHQWYFATDDCVLNPTLGLTAWRVLRSSGGGRFLRVCFSEPGKPLQPTIAADGSPANASFGCADSALNSALPKLSFEQYSSLPANKGCLNRRQLRIRIRDLKSDPLKKVVVKLRSGKIRRSARIARRPRVAIATLNLRGLPSRPFKVSVQLTTVLDNRLSSTRTYSRCGKRKRARAASRGARRHP